MIPAASVLPQAMFPATPVLVLGPAGLLALLAVAALLVLLLAGTMAEGRALTASEQPAGERRNAPALDRAA